MTRFHLGARLLQHDCAEAAAAELAIAVGLLVKLPAEHAKARNLWGVARRASGNLDDAVDAFTDAATAFETLELDVERGAALFNLGLVQRELGEPARAAENFALAASTFESHGATDQYAAALREQGAALLTAGHPDDAVPLLVESLARTERRGTDADRGQAANVLGLAQLAVGNASAALECLQSAVAAHPAGIRPDAHAMAKANLAVAYEANGNPARARLAAAQVLCGQEAAAAVRDQAAGVLARLGSPGNDLVLVLSEEPEERWPAIVREEAARWLTLDSTDCDAAVTPMVAAIEGQTGPAFARAWLSVLLEAPPDQMVELVRRVWRVAEGHEEFARLVRNAIVTFPPPQLFRLEAVFTAETGLDPRR